eukprot:UN11686
MTINICIVILVSKKLIGKLNNGLKKHVIMVVVKWILMVWKSCIVMMELKTDLQTKCKQKNDLLIVQFNVILNNTNWILFFFVIFLFSFPVTLGRIFFCFCQI